MSKKLFYLLLAVIALLPMTLFAGSKGDKDADWDIFNGRDMFSCRPVDQLPETPISGPIIGTATDPANPPGPPGPLDLTSKGPYKLFDNLYYIGLNGVGAFVVKTSAGLIIIDAGYNRGDCEVMEAQMVAAGLNPADVKLILLSHEHVDHYGCATRWQKGACPFAKVAMSRIGWNVLRTRPVELGWSGSRPEKIDMYLKDQQRVHLGDTTIQIVATPGHSVGCVSFIIPVRDHGKKHVVGVMGGTAVPANWSEVFNYYTSVEYFKQACVAAKCDVGLGVHAKAYFADFDKLVIRKPSEPNLLVIGTEKFDTVYLQGYRNSALNKMKSLPFMKPGDL